LNDYISLIKPLYVVVFLLTKLLLN